ncbi:MAG: F0F1 ATP synthase subunit alpha [bacterium]
MSSLPRMVMAPFKIKISETGVIKDIKKMIVRITGLPSCLNGQLVDFGDGNKGIIMGYDQDDVLALMLGSDTGVRLGQSVAGNSEPFTIPVGEAMIGRMVDAMGAPCDGRGEVSCDVNRPVFSPSPLITERAPVSKMLFTGTRVIDAMVPIGLGQRQLIMGDRMTGKTSIATDAILSQRGRDVVCIYCCIGKALVSLEKVLTVLSEKEALPYTIIVAATDSATAGEQYIVPFTAATIGDYLMRQGKDVLVVFDDLTKHAWAYRQISLLLERPPGREAYPGDIFYVQTQLMERAGKLNEENGSGSMTFLGLADTLQGDLTGYIPSNLISICDGLVSLNSSMFGEGTRPAVDFKLSLSIVGGRAQPLILRELSGGLRRGFLEYIEVARLSKLQSGMSREAEAIMKRGQVMMVMFQQPQYQPASLLEEVLLLYGLRMGVLDNLDPNEWVRFRGGIEAFVKNNDPQLEREMEASPRLTIEFERRMTTAIHGFFDAKG